MYPTQSDTKHGQIPLNCGVDLTDKEGFLVKLGTTGALLPTAIADIPPYLCVSGEALNVTGQFEPFSGEANRRVYAKGAGSRGDQLVLADPATPADAGKLRALPVAGGTYRVVAIA
jgi:hypothetical protein